MNISLGASCRHLSRSSIAHLVTKLRYETPKSVTKRVTKPVLTVTNLDSFVTKPVTKPLIFRPTLSEALRNRYEMQQNSLPVVKERRASHEHH